MKILVTGATGLLGNNLSRKLLAEGHEVRVLVRESADERPMADLDLELVRGDIRQADAVTRAVAGADVVVHAAGLVQLGWRLQQLHQQVNVQGAEIVAEAAHHQGARLIHVSTISTLGVGWPDRPATEDDADSGIYRCPYVDSKKAGEACVVSLIDQGLDALIVHPGYLLGPWDWKPSSGQMLIDVVRRWTPVVPGGSFSLTDARDVAAGIARAIQCGQTGRHYIMAGHNMSYAEGWALFARVCGGKGAVRTMRAPGRFLASRLGDLWGRVTGKDPLINSASMGLARQHHTFSSTRAANELGYTNRPAEETVADTWRWFREYGYA